MGSTMAQKILANHLVPERSAPVKAGEIVRAKIDLVLLNDVSGPLALKQLGAMGARRVSMPDKVVVVCDHFSPPPDLSSAHGLKALREFAREQGISHFFDVGKGGIEHTLLPERGLIAPGMLVVGGDSHTCTYGAFGAFGTGFGSTDIAAALALDEAWFMVPETLRFNFRGTRQPLVTGKDLILRVLREIGVDGAIYCAMEFTGDGLAGFDADERTAICNMSVEAGAKTGFVVPDGVTREWAERTARQPYALVVPDDDAEYRGSWEFDLDEMGPLVACPHSPANVVPVGDVTGTKVDQVYIGNCANGTLADLRQAAALLKGSKVAEWTRTIVVPATQRIYQQAVEEGLIATFIEAGAAVSTPTCGACFGGHMGLLDEGEVAVSTTNRNFKGRMGDARAEVYLAGAYVAAAAAVAGALVDPREVMATAPGERADSGGI